MVEPAELMDLLNRMAQRFEDAAQDDENTPGIRGWGQFLDAPKRHKQIGPYGTSAGIIVLTLADRGQSALTKQATSLLLQWWMNQEHDEYAQKRFVQTTRLAILNLALRLSKMSDSDEVRAQVEAALIGRLLTAGMWGDFWITEGLHDPTPRLFPSAIVLFSFTVLHENVSSICGKVFPVADRIEEKLVLSMNLSSAEAAIGAAALLSAKGQSVGRKALHQMAKDALAHRFRLDERGAYFFDYKYSPDADGQSFFGRDYFIIPVEILFGIAGFQRGAPSSLRLMAEGILSGLVENLRGNGGVYRPAATDRLSTIDQVWAAILLKVAAQAHTPPSVYEKV